MKSLRNKVILSAIVLGFALIATIGSTYAWFTVSNTVTVESMQLNVQASNSLLIRVDDPTTTETDLTDLSTYKTTLTNTDILAFYDFSDSANSGANPWKLSPVTAVQSGYASVNGKLLNTMAVGENTNLVRDLASVVAGDKNSNSGKYFQLTFWVYTPSATDQAVVLQDLVITTVGANTDSQDNVVNAIRLAVWSDTNAATIYGIDNDYSFAFTAGLPGYYSGTLASPIVVATDEFNALSELNGDPFASINDSIFYDYLTGNPATTNGDATTTKSSATTVFTLTAMTPTLVTVNIYVEGWDIDAANEIIAAAFNISFKFALKTA